MIMLCFFTLFSILYCCYESSQSIQVANIKSASPLQKIDTFDGYHFNESFEPSSPDEKRRLGVSPCSPFGFNATNCMLSYFFDATSNSGLKWIADASMGSKSVSKIVVDLMSRCGQRRLKEAVPKWLQTTLEKVLPVVERTAYDPLICDLVDSLRNGKSEEIAIKGIQDCITEGNQNAVSQCAVRYANNKTTTEMLQTLLSAVTGWGWNHLEDPSSDFMSHFVQEYKDCVDSGGAISQCLTLSFIQAICDGACETASCQLDIFKAAAAAATTTTDKCSAGLKVGCSGLNAATNTICETLNSKLPVEIRSPTRCQLNCPTDSSSREVFFLTVSFVAVIFLI